MWIGTHDVDWYSIGYKAQQESALTAGIVRVILHDFTFNREEGDQDIRHSQPIGFSLLLAVASEAVASDTGCFLHSL